MFESTLDFSIPIWRREGRKREEREEERKGRAKDCGNRASDAALVDPTETFGQKSTLSRYSRAGAIS